MKALLAAAILFPITFLIFSYLFEGSTSPRNVENYFESKLEHDIEYQDNKLDEPYNFPVCLHQTNHFK